MPLTVPSEDTRTLDDNSILLPKVPCKDIRSVADTKFATDAATVAGGRDVAVADAEALLVVKRDSSLQAAGTAEITAPVAIPGRKN